MSSSLLTLLILVPILGALLLIFIPRSKPNAQRITSVCITGLVFALSIPLVIQFDGAATGFQRVESLAWIPALGAGWRLGVDGISLWMVILTTVLTPLTLLGSLTSITHRFREFSIALLVLESALIGALVATDLLLFFLFWELMLIPMCLLIGLWGGTRRIFATMKFAIYTMVGSALMLVATLYLFIKAGKTFDYAVILELGLTPTEQFWLFAAFGLAFAIKVPVFPFHTWLPDAQTEAPVAGSIVLAGVLSKMGTYALLRFGLPLFPHAMGEFSPAIVVLATFSIVYGALIAWTQTDIKKLIAYSSLSHLGFVVLGVVALNVQSVEGAILQMVNHGISTGALLLLIGIMVERRRTRSITDYGGIAASMPIYATCFIVVVMSLIGVPGTNGFVGEFMILSGSMKSALPWLAGSSPASWSSLSIAMTITATLGFVLAALYMLSTVRRVFFGPVTHPENRELQDMTLREMCVVGPLIALIFIIGLFPGRLLDSMHTSVDVLLQRTCPIVSTVREPDRPARCGPNLSATDQSNAVEVALTHKKSE